MSRDEFQYHSHMSAIRFDKMLNIFSEKRLKAKIVYM